MKTSTVVFVHEDFKIVEYDKGDKPFSLYYKEKFVRRSRSIVDLKNQIFGEDPCSFYTAGLTNQK